MSAFASGVALFLLLNILAGFVRMGRGPTAPDRMLAAQLLGTTGTAILLLLAEGLSSPPLRDVAIVAALLASLSTVVFVRAGQRRPGSQKAKDNPDGTITIDLISIAALVVGAFFFFAGTVGLLRFPDVYTRLHALTKADNLRLGIAWCRLQAVDVALAEVAIGAGLTGALLLNTLVATRPGTALAWILGRVGTTRPSWTLPSIPAGDVLETWRYVQPLLARCAASASNTTLGFRSGLRAPWRRTIDRRYVRQLVRTAESAMRRWPGIALWLLLLSGAAWCWWWYFRLRW